MHSQNLPSLISGAIILGGCAALWKLIRRIESASTNAGTVGHGAAMLIITCAMLLGVLSTQRVAGRLVSEFPIPAMAGAEELAFHELDLIEEELFGDYSDDFNDDNDPDYEPLSGLAVLAVIV